MEVTEGSATCLFYSLALWPWTNHCPPDPGAIRNLCLRLILLPKMLVDQGEDRNPAHQRDLNWLMSQAQGWEWWLTAKMAIILHSSLFCALCKLFCISSHQEVESTASSFKFQLALWLALAHTVQQKPCCASSEPRPQEASTYSFGSLPSCQVNKGWAAHLRTAEISQSSGNLAADCRLMSEPSWDQRNHPAQSSPNCWPIQSYIQ